jgi:hypothetical protein
MVRLSSTSYEGIHESRHSAIHCLARHLDGLSGLFQVPVALLPGKEPLMRGLGGLQSQAERFETDTNYCNCHLVSMACQVTNL